MPTFFSIEPKIVIDGFSSDELDGGEQTVVAFWGHEEISKPYHWRVRAKADADFITQNLSTSAVGKNAAFSYKVTNTKLGSHITQYVNGYIDKYFYRTANVQGKKKYYLIDYIIRPQLYKLDYVTTTQLYMKANELTTPTSVAKQLLDPSDCFANTQIASVSQNVQALYTDSSTGNDSDTGQSDTASANQPSTSITYQYSIPEDLKQQSRQMMLQYGESGLAFFNRLLERDGIFYFFQETETQELLTAADNNKSFYDLGINIYTVSKGEDGSNYSYYGFIYDYHMWYGYAPGTMFIRDYNYYSMSESGSPVSLGNGITFSFNNSEGVVTGSFSMKAADMFQTFGGDLVTDANVTTPTTNPPDEQNVAHAARVRLEAERAWQNMMVLETTSCLLRPGAEFTMKDDRGLLPPTVSKTNRKVLVVRSNVRYVPDNAKAEGILLEGEEEITGYANTVLCMETVNPEGKLDIAFRPQQATPVPKVDGILLAKIDFPEDCESHASDVDANLNRYTLRLIDEASDTTRLPPGQASPEIRQTQYYGGGATLTGTSFPLMNETEIALAFIGGDPDQPVIIGTLYNEGAKSVSQSGKVGDLNAKRLNRLMTSSGAIFEIYDGDD